MSEQELRKARWEYLNAWIWPSWYGGWYCRADHDWYVSWDEAVEAVERHDAGVGIVWPWHGVKERP